MIGILTLYYKVYNYIAGNYGSDFSVSTRLLSTASNPPYLPPPYPGVYINSSLPPPPPKGWQYMLPTDMGTARHLQASGRYTSEPAPNMSLATCHQYIKTDDPNVYSTNVPYNRYDTVKPVAKTMSPTGSDGSHVGGAPPLHHTPDYASLPFSHEWSQNSGTKTRLPPVDTLITSPSTSYPSCNIRGMPPILSLHFTLSY